MSENEINAKLVFLGEGNVGKTSLARKLISEDSEIPSYSTVGIDIKDWELIVEGKKVKAKIWDFGGQEIYYATHQFFITNRTLYLLVWNARQDDSLRSFDYWLNIVKYLASESPVLVIQNKVDERTKALAEQELVEAFPNIKGFYKTSAVMGIGIDELRSSIAKNLKDLGILENRIPEKWLAVKSNLENLEADYITHDELAEVCLNHQLSNDEIELLGRYFHDIGVILYYPNDEILKEVIVINPNWVTEAIYRLFDSRLTQESSGILTYKQIKEIWDSYDLKVHSFLLTITNVFEIAFSLTENTYILPQFLPSQRPNYDWDYKISLRFEYQYDFMPKGIISRFIVRAYDLLEENMFWRNGAIVVKEGNRALVVYDELKKSIKILVIGEGARDFLNYLRSQFEYINASFNTLRVQKLIACNCSVCEQDRTPYYFNLEYLEKFIEKGKNTAQCANSAEMVPISTLLSIETENNQSLDDTEEMSDPIRYEWDDRNNLNFEYRLLSTPEINIMKELASKMGTSITKKSQWREGMVIEREQNQALVRNDIINNKINIAISGIDNLEFLSVLRYQFEKLYQRSKDLKFNEGIKCICSECESGEGHFYEFDFLRKRKAKNKHIVTCPKSADDVSLNELFGQMVNSSGEKSLNPKTIIEQVLINNSEGFNLGGINQTDSKMKIDKVVNKGGQNTFADQIQDSQIIYNQPDKELIKLFENYSASDNEKKDLNSALLTLKTDTKIESKRSAKEKIEEFLYRNAGPIGQSVVASSLFELGKYLLV